MYSPRFQKIFVYYPRGLRTGGPEALHQLVDAIRSQGGEAYLVPRPETISQQRVAEYSHYDAPEAHEIEDQPGNAIVVPEDAYPLLRNARNAERFLWWLSIDNSPRFWDERKILSFPGSSLTQRISRLKLKSFGRLKHIKRYLNGDNRLLVDVQHLAQSDFAKQHVALRLGKSAEYLSDYTNDGQEETSLWAEPQGNTVCFNPKKSPKYMDQVIEELPHVQFQALAGLTRVEMRAALKSNAIYLDLGNHPGKDRMPREAALAGCVVLVARRGSGAFDRDVCIPAQHKLALEGDLVMNCVLLLQTVLSNVAWHRTQQKPYVETILQEKEEFHSEVRAIFFRQR